MKSGGPGLDGTVEPTSTADPSAQTFLEHPFPVTGEHPDAAARVRDLADVIEVIQPVIAADGGSLDVLALDVETGVVRLQLSGACGSCAQRWRQPDPARPALVDHRRDRRRPGERHRRLRRLDPQALLTDEELGCGLSASI